MSDNRFRNSVYLFSAHRLAQLPADTGKEVVFAGRSNAGKSSVINTLAGQRKLARTSRQPGRTRQINFFAVDDNTRLVDLPGYGYARAPISLRQHWGELINAYLERRRCLAGMVLIVDIRRGLADLDRQLLTWCENKTLPVTRIVEQVRQAVSRKCQAGPGYGRGELGENSSIQLFSALKRHGLEDLCRTLDVWLE